MSKAFTRESDDMSADEIAPVRAHLSSGVKNYITRQGANRLQQQIEALLAERRQLVGRSPDPDTKANVRRIETEVHNLQRTLASARVADPPSDQEKVAFGASVIIRDAIGEEEAYQIVGVDESDPGAGRISASSPLARALMNSRAGDKVRFKTPAGDQELIILRVFYSGSN